MISLIWKNKQNIFLILLSIAGFLALWIVFSSNKTQNQSDARQIKKEEISKESEKNEAIPVSFFDRERFYSALKISEQSGNTFSDCKIAGGIVPHHLLPSFLISDFFHNLSKQEVKNIIIISPNHFERGADILTSDKNWQTELGISEVNNEIVKSLENEAEVKVNNEVMAKEFSAISLLPFIKNYLPKAKVVPIILRKKAGDDAVKKLSEKIAGLLKDKRNVLVASIDFSHYLTKDEARKKDQETLLLMNNFNLKKISNLSSSYMDSPYSLITELLTMNKLGIKKFDVLENINSGDLIKTGNNETTSYFLINFCR